MVVLMCRRFKYTNGAREPLPFAVVPYEKIKLD